MSLAIGQQATAGDMWVCDYALTARGREKISLFQRNEVNVKTRGLIVLTTAPVFGGEAMMRRSASFEFALWKWPWLWIDPIVEKLVAPHPGLHGMGDIHFVRWWLEGRIDLLVLCGGFSYLINGVIVEQVHESLNRSAGVGYPGFPGRKTSRRFLRG